MGKRLDYFLYFSKSRLNHKTKKGQDLWAAPVWYLAFFFFFYLIYTLSSELWVDCNNLAKAHFNVFSLITLPQGSHKYPTHDSIIQTINYLGCDSIISLHIIRDIGAHKKTLGVMPSKEYEIFQENCGRLGRQTCETVGEGRSSFNCLDNIRQTQPILGSFYS